MRTIWKYTLKVTDEQKIDMPYVFKFRHVAPTTAKTLGISTYSETIRAERINVWAEVEPDTEVRPHQFRVVGTGHPAPKHAIYIGTAVMPSGLVWHVFFEAA